MLFSTISSYISKFYKTTCGKCNLEITSSDDQVIHVNDLQITHFHRKCNIPTTIESSTQVFIVTPVSHK
jgi:hypothetical protein